jgi:cytochrome P450
MGERACLGKDFAFLEMHLIIPMILQKFRLRPPPGSKITSQLSLALGNRPSINHMILEHLY